MKSESRARVCIAMAFAVAASSVTLGVPSPAMAAATSAESPSVHRDARLTCSGKPQNHVLRIYDRGMMQHPMRCGTKKWGFVHIVSKGRWSTAFEGMMKQTISRGVWTNGVGYELMSGTCPSKPTFRVVYNSGPLNGDGVTPQGVITAYHVTKDGFEAEAPEDVCRT